MKSYTKKLSVTFLALLILVAVYIIFSQYLTQVFIYRQSQDVEITDLSDKQERLTQTITKKTVLLLVSKDSLNFLQKKDSIKHKIGQWKQNNSRLIQLVSSKDKKLIQKDFSSAINQVLDITYTQIDSSSSSFEEVQVKEQSYLHSLDIIIQEYEKNTLQQTYNLRTLILSSSFIILISFLIVGIFIFNPATRNIKKLVNTIQKSNTKLQSKNATLKEIQDALEDKVEEANQAERSLKNNFEELKKTQEYLKASKQELSVALAKNLAITEALDKSAVVYICDISGNIISTNEIFCKTSGYTPEEIHGKNCSILDSGYHSKSFWDDMQKSIMTGATWRAEVCNKTKNGQLYWVDTVINPIHNDNGEIAEFLSISYVITERKKKEVELKHTYSLFEKTSRAASIGTWETNIEEGTIQLNEVSREVYGLDSKEISYEDFFQLCSDDMSREQLKTIFKRCIQEHQQFDIELQITSTDTTEGEKWARIIGIPIIKEKKCERISGLIQDIHEQKQTESEIKKLALIAEKTDNLVIITDNQIRVEWVNESFTKVTGYSLEEVLGKNPATLLRGENTSQEDIDAITYGIESKKFFSHEILNYTKSGHAYWAETNITPVFDDNNELIKYIALDRDITERKLREEEIRLKNQEILSKNRKVARNIEVMLEFSEFKASIQNDWNIVAKELTAATYKSLDLYVCELWNYKIIKKQFSKLGFYGESFMSEEIEEIENLLFLKVMNEEQVLVINDLEKDVQLTEDEKVAFRQHGIQSLVIEPVVLSKNQKGLLVCYRKDVYFWDNEDFVFLKTMLTELKLVEQAFKREKIKEKIRLQHEKIKDINKDLNASINYASRIQRAILPTMEEIRQTLPESFIFFRARDVVSGDFYFYTERNYRTVISAVDCTGHGIPGAFMSMIGNELLHDIFNVKNITKPHKMLNMLRDEIIRTLRQKDGKNQDGMDLALVAIDHYPEEFYEDLGIPHLEYAGAGNPLIYFQDGELNRIKPDKIIIGGFNNYLQDQEFTLHSIPLDKPTSFYIYSDGIQDQFGGPDKRKFSPRRLRELLTEIHQKDIEEQNVILQDTINEWVEGNKQIDDMLLIGAKVGPRE